MTGVSPTEAFALMLIAAGGVGSWYYWATAYRIISKMEARPGQVSVWPPWWMLVKDALPPGYDHIRWGNLAFSLVFLLGNLVLLLA